MDPVQDNRERRDGDSTLGRHMALDVGRRRTGVAISDPTGLLARSLTVIQHRGRDRRLGEVADLVAEHGVHTIVIGYPLHMNGHPGGQANYVEAYTRSLGRQLATRGLDVELCFWDERLSTVEATDIMHRTGRRAKGNEDGVDAVAAAVILQEYLDRKRSGRKMASANQQ